MSSITAAAAIVKIITAGYTSWAAYCAEGIGGEEVKALKALVDAAQLVPDRKARPDGAAQHLALAVAAFGRAYRRAWAGTRDIDSRWRWFDRRASARQKDIAARLRTADISPVRPGDRPDDGARVDALMRDPLASPVYRALWWAFSDPALTDRGEEPPIEATFASKLEFERYYRLAWWEGLQSPGGAPVRAFLDAARRDSAAQVHQQLVADMANWDRRHVFGNLRALADDGAGGPFLPLGEMYVEPRATPMAGRQIAGASKPVQAELDDWLARDEGPYVVAIRADFGRGKSLSARRLVNRLAQTWVEAGQTPSPELWRPIFVRCGDDVRDGRQSVASIVKGAIQRHARALGIDCGPDHPACALPDSESGERTVIVLDGLDEVLLDQGALSALFKALSDAAGKRRRFVVLSRPAVLPDHDRLHGARMLELQPFDATAIDVWLNNWNAAHGLSITRADLAARDVLDLAAVPVLLFMIASTWSADAGGAARTRAELYERFVRQLARGKLERDRDPHRPIHDAAEAIRARLVRSRVLSRAATRADAMLWVLSLLAWRARQKRWAHRLHARFDPESLIDDEPEPLTRADVEQVLHDELGLRRDRAEAMQLGVILTLQIDPAHGRHHVHFGHKSFAEFLVARYWSDRLRRIARGRAHAWAEHEAHLLGANLLMHDDRSFELLEEMLASADDGRDSPFAWTPRLRARLKDWAGECFDDERLAFAPGSPGGLRDDQRAVLRNAALAIGSRIARMDETDGLRPRSPHALRSMLGWFWTAQEPLRLIACKADLSDVRIDTSLRRADLRGATLTGADFSDADLALADLSGVEAAEAHFNWTRLDGATLHGANLTRAKLAGARLDMARGHGMHLRGALLNSANLIHAELEDSDLTEAKLVAAIVSGANFAGCTMTGARLDGVIDPASATWPAGFEPPVAGQ